MPPLLPPKVASHDALDWKIWLRPALQVVLWQILVLAATKVAGASLLALWEVWKLFQLSIASGAVFSTGIVFSGSKGSRDANFIYLG